MNATERLRRVLALALPLRDILEGRVDDAVVPAWCEQRDWTAFLLALDDETVRRAEAEGLAAVLPGIAAPRDLSELARDITAAIDLPRVDGSTPLSPEGLRSVRLRKRAQLSGLLSAVAPLAAEATRIVDVGSGSGHFTRLSAEIFELDAVGLEHDPRRVQAARARAENTRASFVAIDARDSLSFAAQDLAIGLHACGELGDRLIEAVGRARCQLALVSCCLQKISTPTRVPLSALAAPAELRKEHLGLANLTAQAQGVETSIDATIAARRTRYALGQLLRARGVVVEPGAEMSGINRRRAGDGLRAVAELALSQRALPAPTAAEVAHHEAAAVERYAVVRRLSLPRSMLARLFEVLVSLDRAVHLEERDLAVAVAQVFERRVSPRNIGIFAAARADLLPVA